MSSLDFYDRLDYENSIYNDASISMFLTSPKIEKEKTIASSDSQKLEKEKDLNNSEKVKAVSNAVILSKYL